MSNPIALLFPLFFLPLFFLAKIAGLISWPWIWVFSPLWIPLAIVGIILSVALLLILIALFIELLTAIVK